VSEYDTVLFDNDGVLIDPPARETQVAAVHEALDAVGVADPHPDHVDALVGSAKPDRVSKVAADLGVDLPTLWEARETYDERSQFEKFRTGERGRYDDVAAVADLPQRRGVVSNNHHSTVEFVLDYFEMDGLFETYQGRPMTVESLTLKKPNPHYVERMLADLEGESGLYVGDSESDIVAAHRAGLDSVFVRRDHVGDLSLSVEPTYEVADLHGVAALLDE
jgi:HAD superfamily hydrolase (TIGR01549 family)